MRSPPPRWPMLTAVRRTSAWFGDLGDGIHKGNQNDPRVAIIEVVPDEVHYWLSTANIATKMADIVASAVTGKVAAPGQLVTLTHDEVRFGCVYTGRAVADRMCRSNSYRDSTPSSDLKSSSNCIINVTPCSIFTRDGIDRLRTSTKCPQLKERAFTMTRCEDDRAHVGPACFEFNGPGPWVVHTRRPDKST